MHLSHLSHVCLMFVSQMRQVQSVEGVRVRRGWMAKSHFFLPLCTFLCEISFVSYLSYEFYLIVGNWRNGEKDFLCFLYFLRALSYREKLKKRKEIISYISYISYEFYLIVGNWRWLSPHRAASWQDASRRCLTAVWLSTVPRSLLSTVTSSLHWARMPLPCGNILATLTRGSSSRMDCRHPPATFSASQHYLQSD